MRIWCKVSTELTLPFVRTTNGGISYFLSLTVSWSKPLYVLSHSKLVLRDAILRDAQFLESNSVMDYSLLVGLDNKQNVLVLGIIGKTIGYSVATLTSSASLPPCRLHTHLHVG